MNSKKLQHIFFASLFVVSISSSIYLNFHIKNEKATPSITQFTTSTSEPSEELMADIDAFKHLIQSIAKQVVLK